MPVRRHTLTLLTLCLLAFAGCHSSHNASRMTARNRPVAAASPTYVANRSANPVALGAGDSLGQAVFTRFAQARASQPTGQLASTAKTRPQPPIQWLDPQYPLGQASARR